LAREEARLAQEKLEQLVQAARLLTDQLKHTRKVARRSSIRGGIALAAGSVLLASTFGIQVFVWRELNQRVDFVGTRVGELTSSSATTTSAVVPSPPAAAVGRKVSSTVVVPAPPTPLVAESKASRSDVREPAPHSKRRSAAPVHTHLTKAAVTANPAASAEPKPASEIEPDSSSQESTQAEPSMVQEGETDQGRALAEPSAVKGEAPTTRTDTAAQTPARKADTIDSSACNGNSDPLCGL
jgi:hypothetical protein